MATESGRRRLPPTGMEETGLGFLGRSMYAVVTPGTKKSYLYSSVSCGKDLEQALS